MTARRGGSSAPWWTVASALLLSCAVAIAAPVTENQNQYLAHVLGPRTGALLDDWLVRTADPYPFATLLTGWLYDAGGLPALRVVVLLATFVALLGIHLLASALAPGRPGRALAAMALVGGTVAVASWGLLPVSPLHGFAGQYLIDGSAYLQPSLAGVLLLPAAGLALSARGAVGAPRTWRLASASALTFLACALHPTYAVVTVVTLVAALTADLVRREGWTRAPAYAAAAGASTALALLANPGLVGLARNGEATARFAFERIPHHTVITSWAGTDIALLALVALAVALAAPLGDGRWVRTWILAATGLALAAAVFVAATRWTSLALLLPWRVSVLVVPLSATVVAVRVAVLASAWSFRGWRGVLALALAALGVAGLRTSALELSPRETDPAVALVRSTAPSGVGAVPWDADNVRLSASVPVFVDWKSPPYAGQDLEEWWRRVDLVRRMDSDVESFCAWYRDEKVSWLLLPDGAPAPACTATWSSTTGSEGLRLLQRPS